MASISDFSAFYLGLFQMNFEWKMDKHGKVFLPLTESSPLPNSGNNDILMVAPKAKGGDRNLYVKTLGFLI